MGKKVVVIGAGLGGMSAAIMLARKGFKVTLLEKNQHVGGKLNQLQVKGFSFDLGPSIFTLPHIFRPLFEGDGKRLEDYISLQRLDLQWRNFFEDGTVLDLWEDVEKMRAELARFGPNTLCGVQKVSRLFAASIPDCGERIPQRRPGYLSASSCVFMAGVTRAIWTTCAPCRAASTSD